MNEKFVIELQLKGDKELLQVLSLADNSINKLVRGTGEINNNFRIMRNVVAQAFNSVRSIGNLMQQMSQFGLGRFVSAFESTLVSRATGMFTSQLDNAIERFDVMKTFPLMMAQFGISTNASAAALKKMNEAVIGLPTSLSEIVELAQRFVSVMPAMGLSGDELMDKASSFAIAINNAFLAGGNTSQQAYFAMMQLQDLFTKGELTDREWKSLGTGLQGAGLKIAEYLGYQNFIDLGSAFNEGKVSLEEFVDAMIELGSPGGILAKMANIYKMRLSSVFANIGNAFQRLIAGSMVEDEEGNIVFTGGILGTLDQLVSERFADNENINDLSSFIKEMIIPRIDELGGQLSNWIIEHQDEIFGFFDRLIEYDWAGLTTKIADFLSLKWDVLINLLEKIPPGLLAFSSTLAGPAGQALTTFANLLEPLVLGGMWLGRVGSLGAGGAGGWASGASISIPGSAGAGATALGGLGGMGLLMYIIGEQAYLWDKAFAGAGNESHNDTISYLKENEKAIESIKHSYDNIDTLIRYATHLNELGDYERQKYIDKINEFLPELNLFYDTTTKTWSANGELIEDAVGYMNQYVDKLIEARLLEEARNKEAEIQNKIYEKRFEYEQNIREFEAKLFEYGIDPSSVYNENGEIDSDKFYNAIQTLSPIAQMDLANLRGAIQLAESDLIRLKEQYVSVQNIIGMGEDEWKQLVAEFEKEYGEIPEDVLKMIEEGKVTIPKNMSELVDLCKKAIEQGNIPDVWAKIIENSGKTIEEKRDQILDVFANLGVDAGSILGMNLSNTFMAWYYDLLAKLRDLNDLRTEKYWQHNYQGGNVPTNQAYGGSIHFGNFKRGNYHDTIPAILSPGEYVLRKHAVDKIGLDFLNKLNTFNFSGALNSLSQRVGSGMSPYAFAGATANNTRIYNNNAQANITVNNSSQEFTQRRASKWIRGLN